jgi:hypothetical protein
MALEEARTLLRTLLRTIDRKADLSVSPYEGDRPGVNLTVTLRKHTINLVIPVQDLEAATQDSMRRSQLRSTIKRAIDRVTFAAPAIVSTKMVRGAAVEGGFFRPQQGHRTGRR